MNLGRRIIPGFWEILGFYWDRGHFQKALLLAVSTVYGLLELALSVDSWQLTKITFQVCCCVSVLWHCFTFTSVRISKLRSWYFSISFLPCAVRFLPSGTINIDECCCPLRLADNFNVWSSCGPLHGLYLCRSLISCINGCFWLVHLWCFRCFLVFWFRSCQTDFYLGF